VISLRCQRRLGENPEVEKPELLTDANSGISKKLLTNTASSAIIINVKRTTPLTDKKI
jgi:hypothetical protein